MSSVMEKIRSYLKSLGLTYEVQPMKTKIWQFVVPYAVPKENLKFNVVIDERTNFVRFWTIIMPSHRIKTNKKREALYRSLLEANGHLAEVKYFVTNKGDVGVVGHEGVEVLTIDGFKSEFEAIPVGIIHFLTVIAKKVGIQLTLPSPDDFSFYV